MRVIRYGRMIHPYGSGTTHAGEIRPAAIGWNFPTLSFEGDQQPGTQSPKAGEGQCNRNL